MAMWAYVYDGQVRELTDIDPAGRFNSDMVWVDCSSVQGIAEGWAYDGHSFGDSPTVVPIEQQAEQSRLSRLENGITLTSTGTPALNGVYSLDDVSTNQIFQIGLYADRFGVFPSGDATQPYPDKEGTPHMFSKDNFVAFLQKVAPITSAINTQAGIMKQGGSPSWPSQSATIP